MTKDGKAELRPQQNPVAASQMPLTVSLPADAGAMEDKSEQSLPEPINQQIRPDTAISRRRRPGKMSPRRDETTVVSEKVPPLGAEKEMEKNSRRRLNPKPSPLRKRMQPQKIIERRE